MQPTISLVSGTYNRIHQLRAMLDSFRSQLPAGFRYEIILCDGGSTDGTIQWCKGQHDIRLLEHGELRGAIRAFTDAARLATGKYVILANDDILFKQSSVLRALCHLEDHPRSGAVAFADNRPDGLGKTKEHYRVMLMPAQQPGGGNKSAYYAQVGMFRRWLGERIGWWLGVNNEMADSRTYGGDNFLSAKIWEAGYTVDPVNGCEVEDDIVEDELRRFNQEIGRRHNDSDSYYRNFPRGPVLNTEPIWSNEDDRQLRVLYLPIYDPGWTITKTSKHGLRDALQAGVRAEYPFLVYELDYMAVPETQLLKKILEVAAEFQPHLVLTQIQAPRPLTPEIMSYFRRALPHTRFVNWNGDYWPSGLLSQEMVNVLREVELQLVVNAGVLEQYRKLYIEADYWQIGYEEPGDDLPDMPKHDVVWLASIYNENRKQLDSLLKQFDYGLYQPGDKSATLYDFAKGKALYRNAKVGISNNDYPGENAYVSNRLFQILAAGECVAFQQRIDGLEQYTGLKAGVHYVEWETNEQLPDLIRYYLAHEEERNAIAQAGTAYTHEHHSFNARVKELFELLKKHFPQEQIRDTIVLEYIGNNPNGFGIRGMVTQMHYEYKPGIPLVVDAKDLEYLMAMKVWREVKGIVPLKV